jgi:hypothetical protein
VTEGVKELDPLKLLELLQLKNVGVNDAFKEIGTGAVGFRNAFLIFQEFLYEESAA